MKDVIRVFKQIQQTSSTKEKQHIIRTHKDNDLFKQCLKFLLDDNIVTGISNKKIKKIISTHPTKQLKTFSDVMIYLRSHNTGTDVDLANIKNFLYNKYREKDDEFNFYLQMITKNIVLVSMQKQ